MRDRRTNVFSIADVEELGPAKVVEMALARAWDGCDAVYLSFDIDVIEARHGGNEEGLERGAGQRPRLLWVGGVGWRWRREVRRGAPCA